MAIETVDRMVRNSGTLITTFTPTTALTRPQFRAFAGAGSTLIASQPATGAGALTVQYDADDKIGFIVTWLCTRATIATLRVAQGALRRAWQRDIGNYNLSITAGGATGRKYVLGPFETARFALRSASAVQAPVGRNYVRFTVATTSTLQEGRFNIQAFRMPDVRYAT